MWIKFGGRLINTDKVKQIWVEKYNNGENAINFILGNEIVYESYENLEEAEYRFNEIMEMLTGKN